MAADDADWHVVLQDDAVVCPRFVDHLSDAASHVTDNGPVVPYLGTKRPLQSAYQVACRDADRHGAAWIRGLDLSWGVAIALRTELIPEMIAACDGMIQRPYDLRISRWMRRKAQLMCWYTWPSLVDHDDGGESLIAPDDDGRHARRMWDGRTMLRWDGPVVDDPRIPRGSVVRRGLRGGRRGAP